jgi:RNA polymerase sigma-70 factor, ECF subfamily
MNTDSIESPDSKGVIDDPQFIARLKARDPHAFETLVREHAPRLSAIASRFLTCEQDRDDAVQDALISALRAIESFDGDSRLSTWLHRIVVNSCLMKLRSKKRVSRRNETSIHDLLPMFDETGHNISPTKSFDEDCCAQMAKEELRVRVRACIDQLPENYRVVLLMRDIEGLDTAESAQLLGCTEANVKTRLHRARQALRTLLEPVFTSEFAST